MKLYHHQETPQRLILIKLMMKLLHQGKLPNLIQSKNKNFSKLHHFKHQTQLMKSHLMSNLLLSQNKHKKPYNQSLQKHLKCLKLKKKKRSKKHNNHNKLSPLSHHTHKIENLKALIKERNRINKEQCHNLFLTSGEISSLECLMDF